MTTIATEIIAASRINPALIHLVLSVALGMLVGVLSFGLYILGARQPGKRMDGAFWQKAAIYGVCGLVAGYFSMRITIKNNPKLFGGRQPVSAETLKAISENPQGNQPKPKLRNPLGQKAGKRQTPKPSKEQSEEATRRSERMRAEHERRVQEQREKHKRRLEESRKESAERNAKRRREQEAARAAAEANQNEDEKYLSSLNLQEVEKVRDERKRELDKASEQMRAPLADGEDRSARSKRFSSAVKAYQAAFKAVMQKRREARELNR